MYIMYVILFSMFYPVGHCHCAQQRRPAYTAFFFYSFLYFILMNVNVFRFSADLISELKKIATAGHGYDWEDVELYQQKVQPGSALPHAVRVDSSCTCFSICKP